MKFCNEGEKPNQTKEKKNPTMKYMHKCEMQQDTVHIEVITVPVLVNSKFS